MAEENLPQVAFLGLAERAIQVRDGETDSLKWNVLGLKSILLTNFFPLLFSGWNIALGIRSPIVFDTLRIKFKSDSDEEVAFATIQVTRNPPTTPLTRSDFILTRQLPQGWAVMFFPFLGPNPIVIRNPGRYRVFLEQSDKQEYIGEFYCVLVEPAPLTPERIAAIKSNPHVNQGVRVEFSCSACPSRLKVYAAPEHLPPSKTEGAIWYADIPERFTCDCGITVFDLSSIKRNLFAAVGQPLLNSGQIMGVVAYEKSGLENLKVEFVGLIDADRPEEDIQKFIERSPILLYQFPSERLFSKPPILTHFKADFALVTPQKELILIEIERASKRLLKAGGGQHSDLTHAIGQIHSWLHVANDHRLALLDSLRIASDRVSKVRGVVVIGRDAGNDAGHLRQLKGADYGQVTVLTYDDLIAGLAALIHSMSVF